MENYKSLRLVLSLISLIFLIGACGNENQSDVPTPIGSETVRGLITDVQSKSLLELESVDIQDDAGVVWQIEARGKLIPPFTPSHLNEHKVLGLPVSITFHREAGALVLDDITD